MANTLITCNPIVITNYVRGVRSYSPSGEVDHTLDQTLSPDAIVITLGQMGGMLSNSFTTCQIPIKVSQIGKLVPGITFTSSIIPLKVVPAPSFLVTGIVSLGYVPVTTTDHYGSTVVIPRDTSRSFWGKWSKIGVADFTIDRSNEAGERPLDWAGSVYQMIKLGSSIIAYGTNGITIMTPSGVHWGIKTIRKVGIAGKLAVIGTDTEHYFVDIFDKLHVLTESGIKLLDYSEFIRNLSDPVLSLDVNNQMLYICDDKKGYIYSILSNSFGEGPAGITGISSLSGNRYVVSPLAIDTPSFDICTDIYDFGSRQPKTIQRIEVGTDLGYKLEVMIDYRINNRESWRSSRWFLVNPSGIANAPCYGIEFRFHIRSKIYEQFELDYLRVVGFIHQYDYLNTIQ